MYTIREQPHIVKFAWIKQHVRRIQFNLFMLSKTSVVPIGLFRTTDFFRNSSFCGLGVMPRLVTAEKEVIVQIRSSGRIVYACALFIFFVSVLSGSSHAVWARTDVVYGLHRGSGATTAALRVRNRPR